MITFVQLLISGISVGFIYGLIAVGFVLIYKSSQIFNFAQGIRNGYSKYSIHMMLSYITLI